MASLFYFCYILFSHARFNLFWFIVSIIFSFVETGGRVIYRYTTDQTLAGYEEEF